MAVHYGLPLPHPGAIGHEDRRQKHIKIISILFFDCIKMLNLNYIVLSIKNYLTDDK